MLRPEMSDWYPGIEPGVWYPARQLADAVQEARRHTEPKWELESRVPCDEHFLFRGGDAGRRLSDTRTRRGDTSNRPG